MPVPKGTKFSRPEKGEKKEFDLLPSDTYEVVIDEIDLQEQATWETRSKSADEQVMEEVLEFRFEVTEEGEHKGRKLWKFAKPVMWPGSASGDPSTLYRIYCAANNDTLDESACDEVGEDEINALVGKGLRVIVTQKKNMKGDLKNRVTEYLPLKKQKTKKKTEEEVEIPVIEDDDGAIKADDIPFD